MNTDEDPPETMPCHFCKQEVDSEEGYCFGCKHCVCETCERHHGLMGPHQVEQHRQDMSDDAIDW